MGRGKLLWWLLGGVGGSLVVFWLGSVLLHRDTTSTEIVQERPRLAPSLASPNDESNFVGSAACVTCHSEISEQYHQHPMGRSLANAREASEIENFHVTEFSPPGSRRYRIERTADAVRHHEVLLDAARMGVVARLPAGTAQAIRASNYRRLHQLPRRPHGGEALCSRHVFAAGRHRGHHRMRTLSRTRPRTCRSSRSGNNHRRSANHSSRAARSCST
ncbi:MAG: hypothetical protein FD138_4634 [Planctomycetota bacterium]|nr:MAG: hypothetical protein FD138_4634 [Planctomycetota bacterium]